MAFLGHAFAAPLSIITVAKIIHQCFPALGELGLRLQGRSYPSRAVHGHRYIYKVDFVAQM